MIAAMALILAAGFADLPAIDRDVAAFTGMPIGAAGGAMQSVDRRLRLNSCGSPLALSWRTTTRETVVVECPDQGGWRLFVPVRGGGVLAAATPVVTRGDAVTIAITGEGFTVSRPGEALEPGAVGAWIRVRGAGAAQPGEQPMRARVIRPGMVALDLP